MDPIVIAGSGLAGWTVARELRKLDRDTPIVVVAADDGAFYSKPVLSNALALGKAPDGIATASGEAMAARTGVALRARTRIALDGGWLELLARVDNLADRRVVASVIVNEGNARFFEPAPGRSLLLSARWSRPF